MSSFNKPVVLAGPPLHQILDHPEQEIPRSDVKLTERINLDIQPIPWNLRGKLKREEDFAPLQLRVATTRTKTGILPYPLALLACRTSLPIIARATLQNTSNLLTFVAYVSRWNFFVKLRGNFTMRWHRETLGAVAWNSQRRYTSRMLFYYSCNCFGKFLEKFPKTDRVTRCNIRRNLYRVAVSRKRFHR